jgi:hypothetical protein
MTNVEADAPRVTCLALALNLRYEKDVSIKGTVKNGVVVLPPEAQLPEGTEVEVIAEAELLPEDDPFIAAVLKVAKPRPHWPKDYTRNLDQYLYGVPKAS